METFRLITLVLVITAAVVFAVQLHRGNLGISRFKSSSYGRTLREASRRRRRYDAKRAQQSTLTAFVRRGGGVA
ncbi:hypothetical protein [Lentzea kentuckyensis]|uniref:hypothetical protein n=1 Tax=Lentzea kentuckyensis TaxID=360086 RepID=UPI00117B24C3|nr:hypothetical protein [Lentzea kentuckyensis]